MKYFWVRLAFGMLALAPGSLHAGGDEVVVVYNSRLPESKAVADYYARLRQVPPKQIYGFALPTTEEIPRAEFRDSLQKPLAEKLESDRLWRFGDVLVMGTNGAAAHAERRVVMSKIRYAVLCYGVPLKIAPDPTLYEPVAGNPRPEFLRNEAAVDSELAWLPAIKMSVRLSGPLPSWVYGATNVALLNPTNGVLLVGRLDGPTADIARGLVDKAMQAERDGLWGCAYFDLRNMTDSNYRLGDDWIRGMADIARELGFDTTLDEKPGTFGADFPMSDIALYAGWYANDADGPFAQPKVEFMPGAFAYHLHSYSAATVRSTSQNWVGPLLTKGATCTIGYVYEPYLAMTANLTAFLARFAGGFTFGEAALASSPVLSWQTTIVGDPLYRPFARSPSELHAALLRSHSPLIEWSHLRVVTLAGLHGTPLAQVATYLENIDATAHSAVLSEKLADTYTALGKPSSAIDMYQQALKLNPSPEQRIRIRLALGDRLVAAGREADAIEDYKKLLAEVPDYPGNVSVSAKRAALEQKLAKSGSPDKP